jgi:hypothetical protein
MQFKRDCQSTTDDISKNNFQEPMAGLGHRRPFVEIVRDCGNAREPRDGESRAPDKADTVAENLSEAMMIWRTTACVRERDAEPDIVTGSLGIA